VNELYLRELPLEKFLSGMEKLQILLSKFEIKRAQEADVYSVPRRIYLNHK